MHNNEISTHFNIYHNTAVTTYNYRLKTFYRTQTACRPTKWPKNVVFFLVILTFNLWPWPVDLQTCPNKGPNTSSMWMCHISIPRFPRYLPKTPFFVCGDVGLWPLTFDLNIQTRHSVGPNTSAVWIWSKSVQRFLRYYWYLLPISQISWKSTHNVFGLSCSQTDKQQ